MKITVITVVLNDPDGFAITCDSVCEQDYPDIEWLVIDGGSGDLTLNRVKAATGITWWVSERDGGIYQGMNKGIEKCTGDYVIFMNAGDTIAGKSVLSALVAAVEHGNGVDVVLGGTYQKVGREVLYRPPREKEWIRNGLPAFHQSTLYRASLLKQWPYDVGFGLLADYAWLAMQVGRGVRTLSLDIPVSVYQVGGRSYTRTRQRYLEHLRIQTNILKKSYWLAVITALSATASSWLANNWSSAWVWFRRAKYLVQRVRGPTGRVLGV